MSAAGDPAWRQRFTAANVGFPQWSAARPDLLYFTSDEAGSTQGWVHDLASGRRTRLTDQPVGVESLVVTADGAGAAWWRDETGDENGAQRVAWTPTCSPKTWPDGSGPSWRRSGRWSRASVPSAPSRPRA